MNFERATLELQTSKSHQVKKRERKQTKRGKEREGRKERKREEGLGRQWQKKKESGAVWSFGGADRV